MRKLIFALVMTLALLSTFTIGASAHSSVAVHQVSRVVPLARGGGCDPNPKTSRDNDLVIKACISYSGGLVRPDSYVTFRPLSNHRGLRDCSAGVVTYNGLGQRIETGPYIKCFQDAADRLQNKHYYGYYTNTNSGSYYSYAFVNLIYNDNFLSTVSSTSPLVIL